MGKPKLRLMVSKRISTRLVAFKDSDYAACLTLIGSQPNWCLPISWKEVKFYGSAKSRSIVATPQLKLSTTLERMLQAQLGHGKGMPADHLLIGCQIGYDSGFPQKLKMRTSEESEQLRNLLDLVPRLESRVESLEKELSDTKQTLGTAVLKLLKKVKKLEKVRQKRKREDEEGCRGSDSCRKDSTRRKENISIEDRAKFLHDTIAAQRKFLAEQRYAAIRNKPPTISQLRNQMITYLKHVANKKHAPDEDKVVDVEILDHQYPIVEWQSFFLTTKPQFDPTKPLEDDYMNRVTRSNGNMRFFRTLMGVPINLDREDFEGV
ncbi:hypothetical protein Tco_0217812 [Tanacetum coccineum]